MTPLHRRFAVLILKRLVRLGTACVLTASLLVFLPTPASAGLILQVEHAVATSGGTGSFDVVMYATSDSFDVTAFQVELSVAAGSGVTFTAASVATTAASYIFTTFQSAPPFAISPLPSNDLIVADADMISPGFVTVSGAAAVTYGIEHVTFAVAAGTPGGSVTVSILGGVHGLTQIYDLNPDHPPIAPFTAMDGTITIGASAVPEPSTLFLGIIAAMGLILVRPALGSI